MTKEKLEKEAEEYVGSKSCDTDEYSCGFLPSTVEEMLIEFAEPREKHIKELEKQNEKMKCCGNCMHYRHFTEDVTECAMSFTTAQKCRHNNFDKWRLRR